MKQYIFLYFFIHLLFSTCFAKQISEFDFKDLSNSNDLHAWQSGDFYKLKDNYYYTNIVSDNGNGVNKHKIVTNKFNKEKTKFETFEYALDNFDIFVDEVHFASDNNVVYMNLRKYFSDKSYWFKSSDGRNWKLLSDSSEFYKIYGTNKLLVFTDSNNFIFSNDSGNTWVPIKYFIFNPLFIDTKTLGEIAITDKNQDGTISQHTAMSIIDITSSDIKPTRINIPQELITQKSGKEIALNYNTSNQIFGNKGKYLLEATYDDPEQQSYNILLFSNDGGYNWKFVDTNLNLDGDEESWSFLKNFYRANDKYFLVVETTKFGALDHLPEERKTADSLLNNIYNNTVDIYELTEDLLLNNTKLNLKPRYSYPQVKYMNLVDNVLALGKSDPNSIKVQFHDLNQLK